MNAKLPPLSRRTAPDEGLGSERGDRIIGLGDCMGELLALPVERKDGERNFAGVEGLPSSGNGVWDILRENCYVLMDGDQDLRDLAWRTFSS